MPNFLIWDKIFKATIFINIAAFLTGCASSGSDFISGNTSNYNSPIIKPSKSFTEAPCIRDSVNGMRFAFFGLKFDTPEPIVTGYYYCNGNSPAKDAGVFIGDRIVAIRNCRVSSTSDVNELFRETPIRTFPLVDIYRDGKIEKKGIKIIPFVFGTASTNQNAQGCKSG